MGNLVYRLAFHEDIDGVLHYRSLSYRVNPVAASMRLGEWAEAPVGGWLCYQQRSQAIPRSPGVVVLACEIDEPVTLPPFSLAFESVYEQYAIYYNNEEQRIREKIVELTCALWNPERIPNDLPEFLRWPWRDGTVAYRWIKPVAELPVEEFPQL